MSEDIEAKAKGLAALWTLKWVFAMESQGKKVTGEGMKRYREAMKAVALVKLKGKGEVGFKR